MRRLPTHKHIDYNALTLNAEMTTWDLDLNSVDEDSEPPKKKCRQAIDTIVASGVKMHASISEENIAGGLESPLYVALQTSRELTRAVDALGRRLNERLQQRLHELDDDNQKP